MGRSVVMSLDRTMASDYRGTAYFGFAACLPRKVLPDWLYFSLVSPPVGSAADGSIALADCGSRKVEQALRQSGLGREEFVFAHPGRLDDVLGPDTRVFLFGSHDPLGRGPLTAMLTHLMGRGFDAYNSSSVRRMLRHPVLRGDHGARPRIIAGGAGAWELAVDAEARRDLGVDCVVVGEAELVAPELVRKALAGEPLPEVVHGPTVPLEQIPPLTRPTVNSVQEITRGCGRGCDFCVPNLQSLRSLPIDRVCADAEVNAVANAGRVIFHAEDLFRYQALPKYRVNHEAICGLYETVYSLPEVKSIGASHGTLTGVVSSPDTLEELGRIHRRHGNPTAAGMQMGVETGSRRLARRHLAAKMRPFHPDDWPEVVIEGARILHDKGFFANFTLIFGLPGETEEDVRDTLCLVRELDVHPSTIVPMFYVPMGISRPNRKNRPFTFESMTAAHFSLLQACWDHNYRHLGRLWEMYGRQDRRLLKGTVRAVIRGTTGYLRRRIRRFAHAHGARGRPFDGLPAVTPRAPREWTRALPTPTP